MTRNLGAPFLLERGDDRRFQIPTMFGICRPRWRALCRSLFRWQNEKDRLAVRGLRLSPYTGSASKPGFCSGPTMETISDGARRLGDPSLSAGCRNRGNRKDERSMPMTAAELVAWRNQLGWSLDEAARQLGISRRAYVYLEAGVTSRGRKMPFIPRVIRRSSTGEECGNFSR